MMAWAGVVCAESPAEGTDETIVLRPAGQENTLVISQGKDHLWAIDEEVCVTGSGDSGPRCGKVILTTAESATIKLAPSPKAEPAIVPTAPRKGDTVRVRSRRKTSSGQVNVLLKGGDSLPSPTEQVISIGNGKILTIRLPNVEGWKKGDYLCLSRDQARVTCGSVVSVGHGKLVVSRDFSRERFNEGNRYTLTKETRSVASVGQTVEIVGDEYVYRLSAVAGAFAGTNFAYPEARVSAIVAPHWAVGLSGQTAMSESGPSNVRIIGVFANAEWYLRRAEHRGLFGRAGAGAYLFQDTDGLRSESGVAPAIFGGAGWRWVFPFRLNLAVTAGGLYVKAPELTRITNRFMGAMPYISAEAGMSF